jgi:hypothetical protein
MHSKTSGIHSGTQGWARKGALANFAGMLNLSAANGVMFFAPGFFPTETFFYGDDIDASQNG